MDENKDLQEKINKVRIIHRTTLICVAILLLYDFRYVSQMISSVDEGFSTITVLLGAIGLWAVFGMLPSGVIGAIGTFLYAFAFRKEEKKIYPRTIKEKKFYGRSAYPKEIEEEKSRGFKFAFIVGYTMTAILILSGFLT